MKFVIALQFWEQDKTIAMRLAHLIANIESAPRTDVEILFVARFDCDHDHETIRCVAQKFPVHWITTHTKWTGWPAGCNAMAKDTLEWVAANRKDADGVLMMEPDCVPTSIEWLDKLMRAWDLVRAEKWLMGDWRPSGGEWGHINGNCVIDPKVADALSGVITEDPAWDCSISPWVKHRWAVSGIIRNCFQGLNASWADLFHPRSEGDTRAALIHGFKDTSVVDLIWGSERPEGQPERP